MCVCVLEPMCLKFNTLFPCVGTSEEPGILPRTLDVVFNTIKGKQFDGTVIKPKHYQEAVYLTEEQQEEEESTKRILVAKVIIVHVHRIICSINFCIEVHYFY